MSPILIVGDQGSKVRKVLKLSFIMFLSLYPMVGSLLCGRSSLQDFPSLDNIGRLWDHAWEFSSESWGWGTSLSTRGLMIWSRVTTKACGSHRSVSLLGRRPRGRPTVAWLCSGGGSPSAGGWSCPFSLSRLVYLLLLVTNISGCESRVLIGC